MATRSSDSPDTGERRTTGNEGVQELARYSKTVVIWTATSRLTGFARVALLGAVLGPTFFGNLFLTLLVLPYFVCQVLMASLMPAILTPHLVRLMEAGRTRAAYGLACSIFGLTLVLFTIMAVAMAAGAPLILPLLTLAVDDPAVRAEQFRLGWPLIIMMAPQVPLYGIAIVGLAVQQAHLRFALSTAAPAFENIAFILVVVASALVFGVGADVYDISMGQVILLGLGSTAAVGVHAVAQYWGAYRCGMLLVPRGGWWGVECRRVLSLALPSSGNAILLSFGLLVMLVVAGGVSGGAVAFQLAYNMFNLPVALFARPIAAAQLPLLARAFASGAEGGGRLLLEALRLTMFLAIPAAFVLLVLPDMLATLITFGGMRSEAGIALVIAALAGLGLAIIGESVVVVGTSAAYARHDATTPFWAMVIQTVILCAGLVPVALFLTGPWLLAAIGLVFSVATFVAGVYLYRCQVPAIERRSEPSLLRDIACSVAAVLAGVTVSVIWPEDVDQAGVGAGIALAFAALTVTGVVYIGCQTFCRSSQLALVLDTIRPGGKHRLSILAGRGS
jgi:putative peptidoglycan lipid II flippase